MPEQHTDSRFCNCSSCRDGRKQWGRADADIAPTFVGGAAQRQRALGGAAISPAPDGVFVEGHGLVETRDWALLRLPTDSAARKRIPLGTGLIDYFPDALAEVAKVSQYGNEKHNPGEPLHHARGKSMDHEDCIVRHYVDRYGVDPASGLDEAAFMVWRALAFYQELLERRNNLPLPRGARPA